MINSFKIEEQKTIAVDKPSAGTWVNVLPPLRQEEFSELSTALDIPLDFLKDSLDIDERSRYEEEDSTRLIVIKTPRKIIHSMKAMPSISPFPSVSSSPITRK